MSKNTLRPPSASTTLRCKNDVLVAFAYSLISWAVQLLRNAGCSWRLMGYPRLEWIQLERIQAWAYGAGQ